MRAVLNLFKLRIGIVITWTALAAVAVTPGPALTAWQIKVLAVCVLIASAAAGSFNQFVERDIDARMQRTRNRPFVTGALAHAQRWVWVILLMHNPYRREAMRSFFASLVQLALLLCAAMIETAVLR